MAKIDLFYGGPVGQADEEDIGLVSMYLAEGTSLKEVQGFLKNAGYSGFQINAIVVMAKQKSGSQ